MEDHKQVYQEKADAYERLVACEDADQRLEPTLRSITRWEGKDIVEWGAGTGRLTCLIAPWVRSIQAFDAEESMLAVTQEKLRKQGQTNWTTRVADHRQIPLGDGTGDTAIAGWSLCYLVRWNPDGWKAEIAKALKEMMRILRPNGTAILIETLGTGYTEPNAPEHLRGYYGMLEEEGFDQTWIRTDYHFVSKQEAEHLTRFFFGERVFSAFTETARGVRLPECTGIWWKTKPFIESVPREK